MKILCRAPAKINLALHVTGQRDDGYHLLDTLVIFTELGDELLLSTPGDLTEDRLEISGRFSNGLPDDDSNLVMRAVDELRLIVKSQGHDAPFIRIELTKNLPISSGIGGGSADAAATLRGLAKLWNFQSGEAVLDVAKRLGADVPMCLQSCALRARGVGDDIATLGCSGEFHLLLVNPAVSIATMDIFRFLTNKNNPAMDFTHFPTIDALSDFRNDLQNPAISHAPIVRNVLDAMMELTGVKLCRMSGSGATCFGIFETAESTENAKSILSASYPEWWVVATKSIDDREELDRVIQ